MVSSSAWRESHTVADPYEVLQVAPDAESEVVESAYRALARKYHPDVNHSPDAAPRMRVINAAYETLRDARRRAAHDVQRARHAGAPRGAAPLDEVELARRLRPTHTADLFGQLVADQWRRWRARERRTPDQAPAGGPAVGRERAASTTPARRGVGSVVVVAVAIVAVLVLLAVAANVGPGPGREVQQYWRTAASVRARVEASRERYAVALGADTGIGAAAGNAAFTNAATQLVADLSGASNALHAVGQVPKAAEDYQLAQLDDWREEREIRTALRDAAVSRSAGVWAQAIQREAVWRASAAHHRAEALAWQLAAQAAR